MFKSIRWRFIVIYFLLVFISMVIVMVFIDDKLEDYQIRQITNTMENNVKNIVRASSSFNQDSWGDVKTDIQKTVSNWGLGYNQILYVIENADIPRIIAISNSRNNNKMIDQNALASKMLDPSLIFKAVNGEKGEGFFQNPDEKSSLVKHLAYPVFDEMGKVKGIMYITSNLDDMYATLDESKIILIEATVLALLITVILGFFIASSITGPIKDVTVKAEKMARGDFNQYVEVKSNDEIGQLASMFNHLTYKLKETISEMYGEKSKLDTIFTYMADGVIAVNMEGEVIHANPVAIRMLKIKCEDKENKIYENIVNIISDKLSFEDMIKADNLEGSEIVEIEPAIYRVRYAPFMNDKNEIGGLIIVFQDITEQQKLENMRKEFVANVSHELKTPITTIKSYTETLKEGVIDDRDLSIQFLTVVDSECDRMARIVRDLLQLSNLDYNQTKWNKVPLSLNKIIDDAYMKLKISAKEKSQKLSIDIEDELPLVMGDKDGIEQVILNIISNAIKYTPDSGNIEILAITKSNNVIITVKDDGIGIPEEDMGRIFERFYRVDKARSRALGGTGLGLSIAKQIIESHNGQILIKSKFDVGTQVDIILPIV